MKTLSLLLWGLSLLGCLLLALVADTWPEGLFWIATTVWCLVMPFLLPNTWPRRPVKRS